MFKQTFVQVTLLTLMNKGHTLLQQVCVTLTRRYSMQKVVVSLIAAMCLAGFSSLSFADFHEMEQKKDEMKGEMKDHKDAMKEKKDAMKDEMKAKHDGMKGDMKDKKDEMKDKMKDKMGEMGK